MTEPFVNAEVDRTKSKWVAQVLKEFGRPRTTMRALFYFALQRSKPDYPICGSFVGEIRILRPYHQRDGDSLPKWAGRAKKLEYIPADSILEEVSGEHVLSAGDDCDEKSGIRLELWLNRSAFNPILHPICASHKATLVSVSGRPSEAAILNLCRRCCQPTTILCLSDLNISSFSFCKELSSLIAEHEILKHKDIRLRHIGLTPRQVIDLKIPMVRGEKGSKEARGNYRNYLRPFGLNAGEMAELDALEVYSPGGIGGFVDNALSSPLDLDDHIHGC